MNSQVTSEKKRATIIGGSIAGLTCGIALLQRGWRVNIYEATSGELDRRGAGIITHQSLFDALEKLDVSAKEQVGVPIQTRKTFAKDGSVEDQIELPQIATSWGRIYQLLRQQFPSTHYHRQKTLLECAQDDDAVHTQFSDGYRESSDLLIAADGIRSTVRQQLEPAAKPEYAGYVAWRGLINEQDLNANERRDIFPYFTFCLPEGEQVLSYPIAGEHHQINEGERRCNVVWYRPAARETTLAELLTDVDGNNNGESIAPDKVRPAVVQQMQNEAGQLLSPQHARLIRQLEQPFIQPIYDLATSSMAHGRIAIVGDAAHTARPHLGVGITKAAEDALTLVDALESQPDIPGALKHFDRTRRPVNQTWVNRSRELGAYLQAQLLSDDERQYAQRHRTTKAVMRETANLVVSSHINSS